MLVGSRFIAQEHGVYLEAKIVRWTVAREQNDSTLNQDRQKSNLLLKLELTAASIAVASEFVCGMGDSGFDRGVRTATLEEADARIGGRSQALPNKATVALSTLSRQVTKNT